MNAALEPQCIRVPRSISWRNTSTHWRERLSLVETLLDPGTIRIFEKIGVREGWHRLEVAGGGGSIAEWLCRQVGRSGHVVATDLEPRFLEAIHASNLEVWRHNILSEPLLEGAFDLVHARLRVGLAS